MIMSRLALVAVFLGAGWMAMEVGFGIGRDSRAVPLNDETAEVPFAADRDPVEEIKPAPFESKRAMEYLKAICDIGPRISGTTGMGKQQELLKKHFEQLGAQVVLQVFTAKQVSRKNSVEMGNLIVSWHPERNRRVILCSHYDTRPIADQEPNPRKWHEKFVSANDGGSGVALLMELGRHMKELKTTVGVDFVFFDGEEFIWEKDRDRYFFGSEHFAQRWKKSKPRVDYGAAILLDMIGGKKARFPAEGHSWFRAKKLVQEIWSLAAELRCPAFANSVNGQVLDDHLALLNAGIPAIDIIDFSYPHWHRLSDVPENCSPESLEQVARVLGVWLQKTR